ncbi:chemotaxis protein [Bacillus sp. B1-b2]|nr:methyl-accepting chemotaxis protein [Bacillus sp. B1-b2]KAB7668443.1 chemotaxis protein [Bacillus sp. B1-b2]
MFHQVNTLEEVIAMVPLIKSAIPADLSIAICDKEKFIAYFPGLTMDLKIVKNQLLQENEPLFAAIKKKEKLKAEVPADFYGFEFIGTAEPIMNLKGEVIGGIAVQLRRHTEVRSSIDDILNSLIQSQDQLNNISKGSQSLVHFSSQLLHHSQDADVNVGKTSDLLSIIKKVADQTNLLGLNAAIEAARAGEKGKGFEVVANEIRKFSRETVSSTKTISDTMEQIRKTTASINELIENIASIGEEQAEAIKYTSTYMEKIQAMAKTLMMHADDL